MSMGIVGMLGVALVLIIVVFVVLFRKSSTVNLTGNMEDKPAWMRETPPSEMPGALLREGRKVTVFDYDEGEKLVAPFTEQIEDIFRAKIEADPRLEPSWLSRFWRDNRLLKRTVAANFADFRELTKKNSREFA